MSPEVMMSVISAEGADPITAFLTRDWAALGGWSLFISLGLYNVIGLMREWIVPGARHRRLEEASIKQSDLLGTTASALEKQVQANDIVRHFFEETTPRRREVDT